MKKWNILQPKTEVVNRLCAHLQCSPVVASLLANRGIDSPSLADRFLTPSFHQLSDPAAMKLAETLNALKACSDSLIGFGGHAAAAGLEISTERIPEFQNRFTRTADSRISREQVIRRRHFSRSVQR